MPKGASQIWLAPFFYDQKHRGDASADRALRAFAHLMIQLAPRAGARESSTEIPVRRNAQQHSASERAFTNWLSAPLRHWGAMSGCPV